MKILEITRSFYPSIGGMEKFVADRLKIYNALGYDYQVITTTHSEKQLSDSQKLDNVIYLPSYTPYEIVPKLNTAIMQQQYDVISINQTGYYYAVQAAKAAKRKNKKIVLTPHFLFHTDRFKIVKDFHSKFILPELLKQVDKIICFTEVEAGYWKNSFPFIENKIVIIPHYFNPPIVKGNISRNKFGKFLLFLGRGEKNKRIDLLIKAFDKINTDYGLVLTVAKDEISSELYELVSRNKKINLLGRVPEEEKQNLLAFASALILPTDYEAFGIVNLEASYYSKPLILTELSVFKNILDDEGVIYFKNNLSDIEKAIKYFFELDENKKSEMGKVNCDNLQKFSFEKITDKYSDIFKELK
jgi:glycosyltransferase involved in cell wall biosynthesis